MSVVLSQEPLEKGCEKCSGEGHTFIPIEGREHGKYWIDCECSVEIESLKESRKLYKDSNLPRRLMKEDRFENWDVPEGFDVQRLIDIIDGESLLDNWVFIHGNTGTGKTYLAILLAKIALLREKSIYFTSVVSLLENLRPESENRIGLLTKCCKSEVLILDDIGHEKSSQWVRERLYLIINERWNNGLITIFTSNFPPENLKDTVSQAVYSRVKGESLEILLLAKKDKRLINNPK